MTSQPIDREGDDYVAVCVGQGVNSNFLTAWFWSPMYLGIGIDHTQGLWKHSGSQIEWHKLGEIEQIPEVPANTVVIGVISIEDADAVNRAGDAIKALFIKTLDGHR